MLTRCLMNGLYEFQNCILDEVAHVKSKNVFWMKRLRLHRLGGLVIVQVLSLNSILDNSVCYLKLQVGKLLGFRCVFESLGKRGERVSPQVSYVGM